MDSGPNNRNITWTAFNKPDRIDGENDAGDSVYAAFAYDASRSRYRMTTGKDDGVVTTTTTTTYIGALYERVETGGTTTHRFHIFAGGSAIAIYSCTTDCGKDPDTGTVGDTKAETRYFHKDHLGSITVITRGKPDVNGDLVVERFHYSAWGEQLSWNSTDNEFQEASSAEQDRGFTGHVMLNDLGLIHMNGRIYDQHIGRFISADPFVQFPHSTQGYNRYSYVGNNPLSYTDPSGYFLDGLVEGVMGVMIVAGFSSVGLPMVGGAIAGYLATGSLKGAVLGAVAAHVAHSIGTAAEAVGLAQEGGLIASQKLMVALMHGVTQGALSTAGGGRFGDGFLGASVGSMLSPSAWITGSGSGATIARVVTAAIIGGTASKLGGGRFANGAVSGAMTAAFGNARKSGPDFDSMSNEEIKDWMLANSEGLGIDLPDGVTVEVVDKYAMLTDLGVVACDTAAACTPTSSRESILEGDYSPSKNHIRMFRGAFDAIKGYEVQYMSLDAGAAGIQQFNFSRMQHAAFVLGHEAAHARGIDMFQGNHIVHTEANYYGVQAVNNLNRLRGN